MTPGRGAEAHALDFVSRLISALLPTLGYPITAVRTARGINPFATRSLTRSLTSSATSATRFTPSPSARP